MIDYEKLKKAHELAHELSITSNDNVIIQITYRGDNGVLFNIYQNDMSKFDSSMLCISLDELITKLQELTQPKAKYDIGQKVWFLDLPVNEILSAKIKKINEDAYEYEYELIDSPSGKNDFLEKDLYPSRESLIDAQIEYWKGMKQEQIVPIEEMRPPFEGEVKGFRCFDDEAEGKECEHESDGKYWVRNLGWASFERLDCCPEGMERYKKCKKCGDFYR
ncbi:TPA: hypothetical protein JAG59_002004 [Legionella pneumophila]|nr:hypothetical protein [Legionella pneumophila]HAT5922943.1 hypothetical protein [Legionella pneumophila]HAT5934469.1 hypothetical protein [Legionella pneumophila]HAT5950221.1 hypothetical protein [Legionella pneumophila]HAT5962106.1 hypothetical protein [Legionella pneumophila]